MMRTLSLGFFFCLIASCASHKFDIKNNEKRTYSYNDVSGSYDLTLHYKHKKDINFIQKEIKDVSSQEVIETSYVLIKSNEKLKFWIPTASQTVSWLDKKEHFAEYKILPKKKLYSLRSNDLEKAKAVPFVKSKTVCSFSILPICLEWLLTQNRGSILKGSPVYFAIHWDQYPMTKIIYSYKGITPLMRVKIVLDHNKSGNLSFTIDSPELILSVSTDKRFKVDSLNWVAEGLSLQLK